MLQDRLEWRVGRVEKIGTLEIRGFKVVFDKYGVAVLVESEEEFCEGVLYKLNSKQILTLDWAEGVPNIYEKFYKTLENGQIIFLYNKRNIDFENAWRPFLHYLNYIIDGALENNLKITAKRLIEYKNSAFHLKKGSKHKL